MNDTAVETMKRIAAQRSPVHRAIALYFSTGRGESLKVAEFNFEFHHVTIKETMEDDSAVLISYETAQSLMDVLWESGVKPSGGEGHTAHIRALNAHLEDMRRLVFDKS